MAHEAWLMTSKRTGVDAKDNAWWTGIVNRRRTRRREKKMRGGRASLIRGAQVDTRLAELDAIAPELELVVHLSCDRLPVTSYQSQVA